MQQSQSKSLGARRLALVYEVERSIRSSRYPASLHDRAVRRLRELFDADGCALLLLDRGRRDLRFAAVSQAPLCAESASALAQVRVPVRLGIAGWVVEHAEAVFVGDVREDPRFYDGVDRRTNVRTRTVLCAPVRTSFGCIGALQVVNPAGTTLDGDALSFLETLAATLGVVSEQRLLGAWLAAEVGLSAGVSLVVVGAVCIAWSVVAGLAWALPPLALLRPSVLPGLGMIAAGAALIAAVRRDRLVPGTARQWRHVPGSAPTSGTPAREPSAHTGAARAARRA